MERREERIEASENYANQHVHPVEWNKSYCDFKSGTEWADETMINKVCNWIKEHLYDEEYIFRDDEGTWVDADSLTKGLRKAMKK